MSKIFYIVLFLSQVSFAVQKKKQDPIIQKAYDYLIIEVNQEKKIIKPDEVLTVVKGDSFKISQVFLSGKAISAAVNLIGFSRGEENNSNDRNVLINSASDLISDWSLDKKGKKYRMVVRGKKNRQSESILEVLDPVLDYIVLDVEGVEKVLREGETIRVRGQDKFKVNRVLTNIGVEKDVDLELIKIEEKDPNASKKNFESYEMRFYRKGIYFAKIPLEMMNTSHGQ